MEECALDNKNKINIVGWHNLQKSWQGNPPGLLPQSISAVCIQLCWWLHYCLPWQSLWVSYCICLILNLFTSDASFGKVVVEFVFF